MSIKDKTKEISTPENRIIKLAAKGIAAGVIADIVGCSISYVSQIASESVDKIQALKYDTLIEESERDARINALEDRSIGIVETKLDHLEQNPYMMKSPMEAVRMLATLNSLKRRGAREGDVNSGSNGSTTTINIVLPAHIVNKYSMATQGNVLDGDALVIDAHNNVRVAGEQELVTMPSGTLKVKLGGKDGSVNSSPKKVKYNFD